MVDCLVCAEGCADGRPEVGGGALPGRPLARAASIRRRWASVPDGLAGNRCCKCIFATGRRCAAPSGLPTVRYGMHSRQLQCLDGTLGMKV